MADRREKARFTFFVYRERNEETSRAKRSPGEGEAEGWKLPERTQWVKCNPTRERLAKPRKRVLRRRQRWRHEA
jgi:hypothetical protein